MRPDGRFVGCMASTKGARTRERIIAAATPLFNERGDPGKTGALPAVWETKANFDSIAAKLTQDATTAMATIKDDATLKSELPKVLQNCGTCHQTYRKS